MTRWTRKLTYPDQADDDFVVLRDGIVVGRVRLEEDGNRRRWRWYVLTMPAQSSFAAGMKEGLEKVRELAADNWAHEPHGWPVR